MLTTADLDRAANDERWLGYGYLGERAIMLHSTDPEAPADPDLVAAVDRRIIDHANAEGWSYDDLFGWANSKLGRWLADSLFGRGGRNLDADWATVVRQDLIGLVPLDS